MDLTINYNNFSTFIILLLLEVILSVDNIIFIALLVKNLRPRLQKKVRILGLSLALLMRILVLFGMSLLFTLDQYQIGFLKNISVKDLIIILGGIFLIYKSTKELWHDIKPHKIKTIPSITSNILTIICQIIIVDLVFSIDSIITAIGLTTNMLIIILAFALSMLVLIFLSSYVIQLINSYPNIKTIAIVFIFAIGILLIGQGLNIRISKYYIYFAFFFALIIESINIYKSKNKSVN